MFVIIFVFVWCVGCGFWFFYLFVVLLCFFFLLGVDYVGIGLVIQWGYCWNVEVVLVGDVVCGGILVWYYDVFVQQYVVQGVGCSGEFDLCIGGYYCLYQLVYYWIFQVLGIVGIFFVGCV